MTAEIISVGTELLLGNILNTNAQYLSRELAASAIAQVAGADWAGLESHPAKPISWAQAFSASSSVANCLLST